MLVRYVSIELYASLALLTAVIGALSYAFGVNAIARQQSLAGEISRLERSFHTVGEHEALGLTEVRIDSSSYDYSHAITTPQRLTIVLNDGRTWISVHRERLRRRLADPNKETIIFLTHPTSLMLQVLARKGSTEPAVIASKITETIRILHEIRSPHSRLEILGHHLYNPFSVCAGDNEAILTPYFLSRGARMIPILKYVDTGSACYFRDITEDLDRLRLDAEDIDTYASADTKSADIVPLSRLVR
jgi:hypothetical protein